MSAKRSRSARCQLKIATGLLNKNMSRRLLKHLDPVTGEVKQGIPLRLNSNSSVISVSVYFCLSFSVCLSLCLYVYVSPSLPLSLSLSLSFFLSLSAMLSLEPKPPLMLDKLCAMSYSPSSPLQYLHAALLRHSPLCFLGRSTTPEFINPIAMENSSTALDL